MEDMFQVKKKAHLFSSALVMDTNSVVWTIIRTVDAEAQARGPKTENERARASLKETGVSLSCCRCREW